MGPLRLLGQSIEPGHSYEVILLATVGCAEVSTAPVQAALALAGLVGASVTKQPTAMPGACRVIATGTAPPVTLPLPVGQILGQIRVPGMAVVSVRDLTTGESVFPEGTVVPPGAVPPVSPPRAPEPATTTSEKPSVVRGALAIGALALAVGLLIATTR